MSSPVQPVPKDMILKMVVGMEIGILNVRRFLSKYLIQKETWTEALTV